MSKKQKDFTGVRAKLDAHRQGNSDTYERELPASGVKVQIPNFKNHGKWMRAQRQAKGDVPKAQAAFVVATVTFEGEQLTMADVLEGLIDAKDMLFLISEIFGEDDGEEDEGNEGEA